MWHDDQQCKHVQGKLPQFHDFPHQRARCDLQNETSSRVKTYLKSNSFFFIPYYIRLNHMNNGSGLKPRHFLSALSFTLEQTMN